MKGCLKYILGFIAGVILTLFFLFLIARGMNINRLGEDVQVQYIEVTGKQGEVTLYTGMPKDSVRILLGKPDEVNLRSYSFGSTEDWGYKINNQYTSDLNVSFSDGKLESVRQN